MNLSHRSVLKHSKRGGIFSSLLVFIFVTFVVLALCWVLFLPSIVARVVSSKTGFALTTSDFSLNPFTGSLSIRELRLTNPTQFPNPDFVSLPRFEADLDLSSLFSDRLVVEHAAVELQSLTLVRNAGGVLNAQLFGDRLAGEKSAETEKPTEPAPESAKAEKQFLIKHLEVKIGKFVVEDYSGGKKSSREVNLNMSQTYENVTSVKQLLSGPVLANLGSLGSALKSMLPSDWSEVWSKGVESGRQLLKELGKKTSNALRSAAETLEEKSKP